MAGVNGVASTDNVAPGKRKFVVALALIIVLAFAVWLTTSFSAPARVIKHKITLAAVALVKSPWEEKADDWKKMADAPIPLLESAGAVVDGRIYVFGGIERTSLFGLKGGSAVYVYNPKTDSWTRNADMPTAVTHVMAAVDGHKIWFAGGWLGSRTGGFDGTQDVWVYDTRGDLWQQGPPLPRALASGALVRHGRRLHFIGGFLGEDGERMSARHWALDLDGGTTWEPLAPIPEPRGHISAVTLNDRVYAIGGMHGHHVDARDLTWVHAYDPANDTWTELAPLPGRRSHLEASTFVDNGRIYVLGGKNYSDHPFFRERGLPYMSVYDPGTDTWTDLPGLPRGLLGAVAAVIDDYLYLTTGSLISVFHGQSATYRRPWKY